jgi:hypothetical protein
MRHLSADERLTLIEGDEEEAHPHLASCARCRAEIAGARAVLQEARAEEVPEPSPLFWESLSRRVSEETSATSARRTRIWRPFLRSLAPLTVGVGALVVAVVVDHASRSGPVAPAPAPGSAEQASVVAGAATDDAQWMLLANLAADFDVETLSDSLGRPAAGGADVAVWQLNEHERSELAVLLRAELQKHP